MDQGGLFLMREILINDWLASRNCCAFWISTFTVLRLRIVVLRGTTSGNRETDQAALDLRPIGTRLCCLKGISTGHRATGNPKQLVVGAGEVFSI